MSVQECAGRAAAFRESAADRLRRIALGLAYALKPNRIRGVPALVGVTLRDLWRADPRLPRAEDALEGPDGLCGLAGPLSVPVLLRAYGRGLYPFCHVGPMKWWAPRERMVLSFPDYHIAKRLRRQIRNGGYQVTFDRAFDRVMQACARPRSGKVPLTWITPRIMAAYSEAHRAGHAHSFEVWNAAGELVGGGYGLGFGRLFSTESQFSFEPNTSKIGFTVLNFHLARWGYVLNDGKRPTPTIEGMGFAPMARDAFTRLCAEEGTATHRVGPWTVEADLATVAAWDPASSAAPSAQRAAGAS